MVLLNESATRRIIHEGKRNAIGYLSSIVPRLTSTILIRGVNPYLPVSADRSEKSSWQNPHAHVLGGLTHRGVECGEWGVFADGQFDIRRVIGAEAVFPADLQNAIADSMAGRFVGLDRQGADEFQECR
jgi:hypothetical protein